MTSSNCKIVACIIESTAGQGLILCKVHLINSHYFKVLDIYELKHSLAMPNDSNSRSGFKCSGQNKLDRTKRVCWEVHNLIDSG